MATAIPSIACIGIIGRNNNPLHVSIFPSHNPSTNTFAPVRTPLQFSLLLSSTLDVFELRHNSAATPGANPVGAGSGSGLSGEVGLLHAVDERLAAYGWETNTGVKIVVVVDMRGRRVGAGGAGGGADAKGRGAVGLREQELRVVFRAVQSAYVRLLQNPFYEPDEHAPVSGRGGRGIKSRKFEAEVRRVGEAWTPGVTAL
ncbi:Trafficking protein particle complex subunit 2-like protein [Colletotrichum sidae]|uniref:Trafficking protein particle complex subunit 2-like protein n=2 Tax=Colletotrichum orbiculare species complex TaxID=2707354 RepID=A0A4R8PRD5_9PEZI|nr:Trafficking protein particle complex subunit 2-like protein [Colletotrichum spinosum]TEA22838.1 Trafficking protein particle complex subunit 2-like protein [Colletotrichum sidae]